MESEARDLLRRFSGASSADEGAGGNSDEIELGLSLGGCFSSRDSESSRLCRSSSIPTILPSEFPPAVPLVRACSLPVEREEEIRRRKDMQSIKRMQTKRKREEKRNSRRRDEDFEGGSAGKTRRSEFEQTGVMSALRSIHPPSQGSVASQGSSSSGGSEFESRLGTGTEFLGFRYGSDASTAELGNLRASPTSRPIPRPELNLLGQHKGMGSPSGSGEVGTSSMEEMPSVSTRGPGPNGRRIEGFLYRYGRGEDVSIVCVCHGSFLTPAEFVRHAGGGDVAHPLRHIVVNPSPGIFS